jgi:phospholipase C
MLENRSFDHMLGFMKSPDYPIDGLNGNESNLDPNGLAITVSKDADYSGDLVVDPGHHFPDVNTQIFGNVDGEGDPTMTGFVKAYAQMGGSSVAQSHKIMKCFSPGPVPACKIPVLVTLAEQYAVCDRWFSSVPGPTLPNRSFAHAATSIGRVDMNPIWFEEGKTIYELLAESNVKSKIYFHDMTMAMTFKNLLANQSYFGSFDDFLDACDGGKLPPYSFLEPRYYNDNVNHFAASDQHPDHDVAEGETLIHDVYNAIRNKQSLWESTVLLIVYDEHGGLYDHVPPPATVNPDGKNSLNPPFDFMRLGIRVPAIVVSPWIEAGIIDHLQYDHASIAATARKLFLGDQWRAKYLTARDQIANTFDWNLTRNAPRTDKVDFSSPPHKAVAIARMADTANVNARIEQHAAEPLSDLQKSLVQQAHFVNQHVLPPDQGPDTTHDQVTTQGQAAAFHAEVTSAFLAAPAAQAGRP